MNRHLKIHILLDRLRLFLTLMTTGLKSELKKVYLSP